MIVHEFERLLRCFHCFFLCPSGRFVIRSRSTGFQANNWRVGFAAIGIEYSTYKDDLGTADTTCIGNGENPPCLSRSDCSSSGVSPGFVRCGGISVCQLVAASLTPFTTSLIRGLCAILPSQHFWMSCHNESEIPISFAFAGSSGREPRET